MAGRTDAAAADAAPAAVVATIDPCDPKRMMFDSLDLLAYEIITNPSKRMERKGQLEVRHMCQTMCLHVDVENYVYRVWLADVMSGFGRVCASPPDPLACGYWYFFHSLCSVCSFIFYHCRSSPFLCHCFLDRGLELALPAALPRMSGRTVPPESLGRGTRCR